MEVSGSVNALGSCVHLIPSESSNISSRESISSSTSDGLTENYGQGSDRIIRLEQELNAAKHSIAEKEARCMELSELQNHVDSEVQELTEKLFQGQNEWESRNEEITVIVSILDVIYNAIQMFWIDDSRDINGIHNENLSVLQEAYRMVNDAESRRVKAEKLLAENHLKIDMLVAEVEALKIIVKSPISSRSQIAHLTTITPERIGLASRFLGSTRRKERHISANSHESYTLSSSGQDLTSLTQNEEREPITEIDPIYHREFTQWREQGASMVDNSPFLSRIIMEDVCPCLNFSNIKLTEQVLDAIKANTLELEVSEAKPAVRTCALSMVPRFCPYKMRVNDNIEWCYISLLARNRVCYFSIPLETNRV